MADTQIYGTMCTDIGNAAIANSVLTGTKVNFAQIVVGDGNGTPYVPVSGQTALKHQVWSGAIAEVTQDPDQPNRMILHAILPSSVGGWVMREIGVLDDKGQLLAVGNTPEIPKEVVTSGAIMEMDLYIYITVVDARGVNVVIDPTVVIASKADLAKVQKALDDFKKLAVTGIKLGNNTALAMSGNVVTIPAATEAHDGYMSKEQAVQLAGTVPNTRKINNHTLTSDLSLTASDVGARPNTWTPDLSPYQLKLQNPTAGQKSGTALGEHAVCLGSDTTASGHYSTALGYNSTASWYYSTALGANSTASGVNSTASGHYSTALGANSTASGDSSTAHDESEFSMGEYNKASAGSEISFSTANNALVIGNGTSNSARSNCFRVQFNGNVYGLSSYHTSGADYSEFFEWQDENPNKEDRVGRLVTLDGEKIRYAKPDDDILGIVSALPAIIGDSPADSWKERYACDVFGRRILEEVIIPAQPAKTDENGVEIMPAKPEHTETRFKTNPTYDPAKENEYENREKRPEWSTVGMLGKLVLIDDGTCTVNGYARPSTVGDGTATAATSKTSCRVMSRLDSTHIKVLLK